MPRLGYLLPTRERTGRLFDGWFPNAPSPADYSGQFAEVRAAAATAGRDPAQLTGAMYLTLTIDDDAARAEARINAYLGREAVHKLRFAQGRLTIRDAPPPLPRPWRLPVVIVATRVSHRGVVNARTVPPPAWCDRSALSGAFG